MSPMGHFEPFRQPDAKLDAVEIEIDHAAGLLDECPVCRGISDRQRADRLPASELLAQQRFDHADPSVAVFASDRGDLLRRLRSVRDRFDYNCICEEAG